MRISEAIEALVVATLANGRSQRTAENYSQKLGVWLDALGDVDVREVTANDLRRVLANLRSRDTRYGEHPIRGEVEGGLSEASIAGYVRAIKRLYNWLEEEGEIDVNPARRLKTPKPKRRQPKAYLREDLPKLLAATAGDEPAQRRDRALLLFIADTGCRVGALTNLRLGDLDLENRVALLREKGDRVHRAPFTETTRAALARWLEVRPEIDTDHVWTGLATHSKGALTVNGVEHVFKRLKRRSGAKGPVNPHAFRHGFAREYLRTGGDLASLADLLGHSDVSVTWQHYAIFLLDELQRKHEQHSPIANLDLGEDADDQ